MEPRAWHAIKHRDKLSECFGRGWQGILPRPCSDGGPRGAVLAPECVSGMLARRADDETKQARHETSSDEIAKLILQT